VFIVPRIWVNFAGFCWIFFSFFIGYLETETFKIPYLL
jgi:hypothetical protein